MSDSIKVAREKELKFLNNRLHLKKFRLLIELELFGKWVIRWAIQLYESYHDPFSRHVWSLHRSIRTNHCSKFAFSSEHHEKCGFIVQNFNRTYGPPK